MKFYKLQNFILFGIVSIIFMTPAIWNGFPLIFTDSLSYLHSGVELVAPVDRPIFYGLFTRLSNLILDLWGLLFLQSVLVIFLLLKLASILFPDLSIKNSLIWLYLIGLTTSVPWFISQISADIFISCLFLTMVILALVCERASFGNIIFLAGLMILEICMHSGNLIIGFLLFLCILSLLYVQKKSWSHIKKFSLITIGSFIVSISSIVASNVVFDQGFTFNRWGKVIFLARVLEDGPGLRYLNDICATRDLKTCAALPLFNEASKKEEDLGLTKNPETKNLVLNALLWDGGINLVGGLSVVNSEALEIIRGAIRTYPLEMAHAFAKNTYDQFTIFTVGNQFGSTAHLIAINNFFQVHFPTSYKSYINYHQSKGGVNIVTNVLNPAYNLTIIFSGSFILVLAYFSFRKQSYWDRICKNSSVQLVIFSLLGFLISNAMITGGISAVFDRYQSRVIWLLPAITLLCIIESITRKYKKSNFLVD